MLAYLLALVVILVAVLLVYAAALLLHLHGTALILLATLIMLAAIAAAVVILVLHFRAKKRGDADEPAGGVQSEVDVLLNDANRKLRSSQQGARPLDGLPLLYLLGDAGAAKTTLVLRSGLDPELIAGTAPREGNVPPTPVINVWFTRLAAILEAGEAVRQNTGLLQRLTTRTRPKAYRSTFGSAAPSRAAVVCVSLEQFLAADAAAASIASARNTASQLRDISRLLGAALPVYVIFTKLDRIPHFAEYIRNLSNDEVRQVLGKVLPGSESSPGVYVDRMSQELGSALDLLTYSLGEYRVEVLNRETEPKNGPGVYEFPREFGKLRKNLNQYLVELCKPSQLSANPYLRGFFFTGLRAQIVEQRVAVPAAPAESAAVEMGATKMFSLQESAAAGRSPVQQAAQQVVATRAPQWTFLPRLFPEMILGDKSALSTTQQTAPARLFRRVLFASLAFLFALYTICLLVSYANNAALEHRIQSASEALPANVSTSSLSNLQALDQLRHTLLQLQSYQQNGAPWSYRFGLYQGNNLIVPARRLYFDRFRTLLLNPAQANLAGFLRGLPSSPAPGADYTAAYNPLKAYLITTSNPEKSQPQFLTPVLLQYWRGPSDPQQQQLAGQQIDFYGAELLRQNPYSISPNDPAVAQARTYLSNFGAVPRIYQDMLTAADKTGPGVDFNRLYPNAASSIVESHFVRGAFARAGFAFMQAAMPHPEHYFQGETWVLGQQAASSLDTSSVSKQLSAMYSADFLKEWHAFLTDAHFTGCGAVRDLPNKLNALAGPDSPLLEFFGTASYNTAVSDPQIKAIFQPAQVLVDPSSTARFIGPGNTAYVNALLTLSGAVSQFNQNPQTSADMLASAVSTAGIAVQQTAQPFNIDPQMHTEKTVLALLQAPIKCAVPPPPPPPPGAPGTLCALLGKFPFQPLSKAQAGSDLAPNQQASVADVAAVFTPGTGSLWTYYDASLKPWLIQQGTQYVLAPNAAGHVGPVFARFFNRAAAISSALYSSGGNNPAFTFILRAVPSKGIDNATLVVDGQRIPAGSSVQQFTWNGATAHQASLAYNSAEALQFQGPWALFQLVATAQVTRAGAALQLEFPLEVSGRQLKLPDGTPEVVRFEITGPGAQVLAPSGLYGGSCVAPVTK